MIQTVTGPIPADKLGATLMHEHLVCSSATLQHHFGNDWLDENLILQRALRFTCAKEMGISTIVDGTPLNLGRDVRLLKRTAELTGLHIVASTGMYYTPEFAFQNTPPDILARYFIDEFQNGIQDTGIRPGIIKCAIENQQPDASDNTFLHTFAITAAETGLPVYIHSNTLTQSGLAAVRVFLEHHIKPDRLLVGHCADSWSVPPDKNDYPDRLLELGVNICVDRLYGPGNDFEAKANTIARLVAKGFAPHICLAHDNIACENKWNSKCPDDRRRASCHDNPRGFAVIPEILVPKLRQLGVSQDDIQTMLQKNPARLLDVSP